MGKKKTAAPKAAAPNAGGQDEPRAKRPMPTWLRRAICFLGSVFLMLCAVYMLVARVLGGNGLLIGIVGTIVFAVMAVHLFRAGLADGVWRVER